MGTLRETDLYGPIKTFLEGQGYTVKSEILAADVVAVRGDEEPIIVEMKLAFNMALLRQGVERLKLSDAVYLAVPRGSGHVWAKRLKSDIILCRRLGLGLVTVRLRDGLVEAHCDPGVYAPRKSNVRRDRLLKEFARRVGDPNTGGATRVGLVTAYRQDALLCAQHLSAGACKGAQVARATGVARATRLMADNHYGWFLRVETGIYALTEKGRTAIGVQDDISAG